MEEISITMNMRDMLRNLGTVVNHEKGEEEVQVDKESGQPLRIPLKRITIFYVF